MPRGTYPPSPFLSPLRGRDFACNNRKLGPPRFSRVASISAYQARKWNLKGVFLLPFRPLSAPFYVNHVLFDEIRNFCLRLIASGDPTDLSFNSNISRRSETFKGEKNTF